MDPILEHLIVSRFHTLPFAASSGGSGVKEIPKQVFTSVIQECYPSAIVAEWVSWQFRGELTRRVSWHFGDLARINASTLSYESACLDECWMNCCRYIFSRARSDCIDCSCLEDDVDGLYVELRRWCKLLANSERLKVASMYLDRCYLVNDLDITMY